MKTYSQNNNYHNLSHTNRLNKTDMSMILKGLAPEENYTNIQLPTRNVIRPNLNNVKPIKQINLNRIENTYNVLIPENTNMEKRHSMNMLSMRRTSNLKSFEIAPPQSIKESVQAVQHCASNNSHSQNNQPEHRMSIEMEDSAKDTSSVKKKQTTSPPVICISSDSSDVEDSDQEEEEVEAEGCSDDDDFNSSQDDENDTE